MRRLDHSFKRKPEREELVINTVDILVHGDDVLLQQPLQSRTYTAGRDESMFIDELSACDLRSLSFLGNGQKEHPLLLGHLIIQGFVGIRSKDKQKIIYYHKMIIIK